MQHPMAQKSFPPNTIAAEESGLHIITVWAIRSNKHWKVSSRLISKQILCCSSVRRASGTSASSAGEGRWCSRSMGPKRPEKLFWRMRPMSHFHWNDWGAILEDYIQFSKYMHGLVLLLLSTTMPDEQKAQIFSILTSWGLHHLHRYIHS